MVTLVSGETGSQKVGGSNLTGFTNRPKALMADIKRFLKQYLSKKGCKCIGIKVDVIFSNFLKKDLQDNY